MLIKINSKTYYLSPVYSAKICANIDNKKSQLPATRKKTKVNLSLTLIPTATLEWNILSISKLPQTEGKKYHPTKNAIINLSQSHHNHRSKWDNRSDRQVCPFSRLPLLTSTEKREAPKFSILRKRVIEIDNLFFLSSRESDEKQHAPGIMINDDDTWLEFPTSSHTRLHSWGKISLYIDLSTDGWFSNFQNEVQVKCEKWDEWGRKGNLNDEMEFCALCHFKRALF